MRNAPPEAVARFVEDLNRIVASEGKVGVAVSGGPDSLALLLLASTAFAGRCHAATVDHRLRPESADEAAFVAQVCEGLSVPHTTLTIAEAPTGNVSDWARRARYRALDIWAAEAGLDIYMTAHHADDQLETLLMRLNRGSGVAGLAGIRARQGKIVRPLLHWRRAELGDLVADAGLVAITDLSNSDDRYDRARLRKNLGAVDWLDPAAASLSAAAVSNAEAALEWATETAAAARIVESDDVVRLDPHDLPVEIVRRLIIRTVTSITPGATLRGEAVSRLLATLSQGGTATIAGVRCRGGAQWRFTLAPPRRGN